MNTYNYHISPEFTLADVRFPENLIILNLNFTRSYLELNLTGPNSELNFTRPNPELKLIPAQIFDTTDECVICYNKHDTVFGPCGHFAACMSCAEKCTNCSVCRCPINYRFKRSELPN
jgi:hypothetical protein